MMTLPKQNGSARMWRKWSPVDNLCLGQCCLVKKRWISFVVLSFFKSDSSFRKTVLIHGKCCL